MDATYTLMCMQMIHIFVYKSVHKIVLQIDAQ